MSSTISTHLTSKACKYRQKAAAQPENKSKSLLSFFGPWKLTKHNVPQVASPPLVHADPIQPIELPGPSFPPPNLQKQQEIQDEHVATLVQTDDNGSLFNKSQGCEHAVEILQKLQEKMESIPKEIPLAGPEHPLAIFSEHLAECANGAGIPENDWEEILNPKMKSAFGWSHDSVDKGFAWRDWMAWMGSWGLLGTSWPGEVWKALLLKQRLWPS